MGMGSDYSNRIAAGLETLLGSDYSQGALSNSADDADGVRSRLNYRLASLELRRQKNIEDVLLSVYSLFTFLDDVEDERDSNDLGDISFSPINSDWLALYIRQISDVSDPDMQGVWAQVLAGEACKPGSISLRALEILNAMTPDDADICSKVGQLAFSTGYIFKIEGHEGLVDHGLTIENIDRLRSLCLIWEAQDLTVTFLAPTKGLKLSYQGCNLVLRHPSQELFSFPAFRLHPVCQELCGVLSDGCADEGYLRAFAESLRVDGYDHQVQIGND